MFKLTAKKTKISVYREEGNMSTAHTYVVLSDCDDEQDVTHYNDEYTGSDGVRYVKRGNRKTLLYSSYYTDNTCLKIYISLQVHLILVAESSTWSVPMETIW
jgi:hypothetical protein